MADEGASPNKASRENEHMAETVTRSPVAPATEEEETFEVDLEGGDTPEGDPDADEVAAAAAGDAPPATPAVAAEAKEPESKSDEPTPEVTPEPAKAKVEPPTPEVARERLHPAVREERNKRKEYARLYAEAREQLDAAEQRIRLLTVGPTAAQSPALKKWHEELAAEADKAATMGDVLRLSIREMDRRDQQRVQELNAQLYGLKCDVAEMRARVRHSDWEQTIQQAGLFAAIMTDAQGNFHDPILARRVYYTADGGLAPDPAERLYRLAAGKLEYERTQRGEPEMDEAEEGAPAATTAKKVPVPAAEAERRGAQRVIEQVSKNSTRPKGIRSVPKAGVGPTRVSRQYLDELMDTNPAEYNRLLAKSPGLERFHLGG